MKDMEEKDERVVLFLSSNENALKLYNWLKKREHIILFNDMLLEEDVSRLEPKLIVSYNYKHIIRKPVLDLCVRENIPIINLHISYLPWNKGSNPNYWSFVENTIKGVTIHKITPKLDAGAIIYRKEIVFDESKETFASTYQKLNDEIVNLFIENWDGIKSGKYIEFSQEHNGSYHNMKDFNDMIKKCPVDWSENIKAYLEKLKGIANDETTFN